MLVLLAVGVHFEALNLTTTALSRSSIARRLRVLLAILAAIAAHVVEVLIFASGWSVLIGLGVAEFNIASPTIHDIVYFSFSTYSSLGYGDIVPLADARILAGVEAVTGLVLIAWTASFSYLEMRAYWKDGEP